MGQTKLSVVLLTVFAVKCLSMTYHELEDFAEYLEKTSQLSPTLKSKWIKVLHWFFNYVNII